jgi:hypothetical protein|tara:strand:+ start:1463 stop:1609 length:147 start_codon:yes stop_codon:yes gene_type:complete
MACGDPILDLVMIAVGAAMIPIGFSLFWSHRRLKKKIEQTKYDNAKWK